MYFTVSITVFLLAFLLILKSKMISRTAQKMRRKRKIPNGKIIYKDLNIPAKSLFSKRYRIMGKPDYILKKNDHLIPVEVKMSNNIEPQKNHVLQLAAYCQIMEDYYGSFVPYGILAYNDAYLYKIPFTPKLRFELENTVKQMRIILNNQEIIRNHNNSNKCKSCSFRIHCQMKIG